MKTGQDLDEAISEHQHLVKVLRSTSHDDDRREAKKQAAELKTLRRQKVRNGLPAKSAPDAYPGVEPGDSLYIHHPERGPMAVKVHAQGRHGITATDSEGNWHRAKWQHVLGAKQRLSQRLTLVDQGEDGAITEDESGQRRYVAIDPEARPDQEPLRKSQPTAAQIEAGNYRKEHLRFQGLDISIENPKGSVRTGTGPGGKPWRVTMRHAYGYIRGTCGVDKDHVDCYVGPNPDASHAYVVHQRQARKWSRYDEDKVMLGFDSAADAKAAYLAQYDDPRFFGTLTAMPMADFKRKALATRNRPQMIKALILFLKADVKGHTRRLANGKIVTVKPYRDKRGHQADERSGELFGATPARPHVVRPTPAPTPTPAPKPAPAPEPTPTPKPRKLTKIEKLRASMADLFATMPDPEPTPAPIPIKTHFENARNLVLTHGLATGNELAVLVNARTGETLESKEGTNKAVTFTDSMMALLRDPNQSVRIFHNHPSGHSLSPADLLISTNPGSESIEAAGHDGSRYRGKALIADRDFLEKVIVSANESVCDKFKLLINSGTITVDQAEKNHWHAVNKALAYAGVIEYESLLSSERNDSMNSISAAFAMAVNHAAKAAKFRLALGQSHAQQP